MRYLILLIGVLVVVVLGVSLWFEEGEVASLVTFDAEAQEFKTGLWIVDVDGVPHLRAYSVKSAWLRRLRAKPEVKLTRDGKEGWYRAMASDDEELQGRVTEAMAEKYGRLNGALLLFRSRARAVPIRLEAVSADHSIGAAP